jgi:AcrR family transcriptional regulator
VNEGAPAARDDASPRAVDGRVPGRRGRATRQRLIDTTHDMLQVTPYRDLKVVDIARAAGTSPATFYQYFPHVEAALLALAEDLAERGAKELRALIADHTWTGPAGFGTALAIADGYLSFWNRHGAVIGVMDLAALDGDRRFRDLRTRLLNGATMALRDAVAAARDAGRVPADTDPLAVAVVLSAMLAHVAAHRPGLEDWGVAPDNLRTAMARIICWSVAP